MDARELFDWQVLEVVDPWGQSREDARFAHLCSVIMDSQGAKKQNGERYQPSDFLLHFEIEQQQKLQSPDQIEQYFRVFAVAHNLRLQLEEERLKKVDALREKRLERLRAEQAVKES